VLLALDYGWALSLDGVVLLVGGSLSNLYGLHLVASSPLSLVRPVVV